jgi:hypothetical protein
MLSCAHSLAVMNRIVDDLTMKPSDTCIDMKRLGAGRYTVQSVIAGVFCGSRVITFLTTRSMLRHDVNQVESSGKVKCGLRGGVAQLCKNKSRVAHEPRLFPLTSRK